jgi:outer membrane protein OmpA-like peptidoglycan-associated protein
MSKLSPHPNTLDISNTSGMFDTADTAESAIDAATTTRATHAMPQAATFKARLKLLALNDNAAFIPTLLVSLLLLAVLAVMYAKGYSHRQGSMADALKSPHVSAEAEAADNAALNTADSSSKQTVVLPPEPPLVTAAKPLPPINPVPVVVPTPTPEPVVIAAPEPVAPPAPKPVMPTANTHTSNTPAMPDYARTFQQGCDALVKTMAAIQFEPRTNYLNAASKRSLDPLLTCFKSHAVRISGHTDSIGTPERKLEVSQLRAGVIKEYLISQGVPAAQLQATGMSDSKPLANNDTSEGRAKNRRIEFVLEALTK